MITAQCAFVISVSAIISPSSGRVLIPNPPEARARPSVPRRHADLCDVRLHESKYRVVDEFHKFLEAAVNDDCNGQSKILEIRMLSDPTLQERTHSPTQTKLRPPDDRKGEDKRTGESAHAIRSQTVAMMPVA